MMSFQGVVLIFKFADIIAEYIQLSKTLLGMQDMESIFDNNKMEIKWCDKNIMVE